MKNTEWVPHGRGLADPERGDLYVYFARQRLQT